MGDEDIDMEDSSMCDAGGKAIHVGSIVDAHWGGGSWYAGRVTGIKAIGGRPTASVRFADGDAEDGLGPARLRLIPRLAEAGGQPRFAVGARVEARWQGGEPWYPGRIKAVRVKAHAILGVHDTYSVAFDDGDFEEAVAFFCVRRERKPGDEETDEEEDEDEDEEEDDEEDEAEDEEAVKGRGAAPPAAPAVAAVPAAVADAADGGRAPAAGAAGAPAVGRDRAGADVRVGDRIQAQWAGGEDWWPAHVVRMYQRGDGWSFDLRYLDGSSELAVPDRLVRVERPLPPAEGGLHPGEVLAVGSAIQARWQGFDWWPARVTGVLLPPAVAAAAAAVRGGAGVADTLAGRALPAPAAAAAALGAPAGEEVYQVTYDDGTVEEGVQRRDLRHVGFGDDDDDDAEEAEVAEEAGEAASAAERIAASRGGRVAAWGRDVHGERVRVGEWVEGDWLASGRWWTARITAIAAFPGARPHGGKGKAKGLRKDGAGAVARRAAKRAPDSYLFWLRYVDGSVEGPLAAAMVRREEHAEVPEEEVEAGPLQVGDAVFGRWLGGPDWWAAKVVAVHRPEPAAAKAAAGRLGEVVEAGVRLNHRVVKAVAGSLAASPLPGAAAEAAAAPGAAAAGEGGTVAGAGAEPVADALVPAVTGATPPAAGAGAGAPPGEDVAGRLEVDSAEDEDASDGQDDSDDYDSDGSAHSVSDLADADATFTLRYDADGAEEAHVRRCYIRRGLPPGAVDPGAVAAPDGHGAVNGRGVQHGAAAAAGVDGVDVRLPQVNGRIQYGAVPGHGPARSDDEEDDAEEEAPVCGHAGGHRVIPGTLVEARYDDASRWAARVQAVYPAAPAGGGGEVDRFDLVFLDGVVRRGVSAASVAPVRHLPYPASAGPRVGQPGYQPLRAGTRVQARWLGGGDWWPAVVRGVQKGPGEGEADDDEEDDSLWTYDIDYDDGSSEVFLPRRYIKRDV